MAQATTFDTHAFVFNVVSGPVLMPLLDAVATVRRFPDQWSLDPWSDQPQDRGQFVHVPSDWRELDAMARRSVAAQIWRDMSDRDMAEVDAALAGRYAMRFNAITEANAR